MAQLINKGLRAQLQTGSLLTGQLLVDLDFHPKSKIVLSDNQSVYPEFPTTASSLDQFTHSANIIMDKVAKLPLEDLTAEANKTLQSLQGTSKAATVMLELGTCRQNHDFGTSGIKHYGTRFNHPLRTGAVTTGTDPSGKLGQATDRLSGTKSQLLNSRQKRAVIWQSNFQNG